MQAASSQMGCVLGEVGGGVWMELWVGNFYVMIFSFTSLLLTHVDIIVLVYILSHHIKYFLRYVTFAILILLSLKAKNVRKHLSKWSAECKFMNVFTCGWKSEWSAECECVNVFACDWKSERSVE